MAQEPSLLLQSNVYIIIYTINVAIIKGIKSVYPHTAKGCYIQGNSALPPPPPHGQVSQLSLSLCRLIAKTGGS